MAMGFLSLRFALQRQVVGYALGQLKATQSSGGAGVDWMRSVHKAKGTPLYGTA